jgi:hypothetical protein
MLATKAGSRGQFAAPLVQTNPLHQLYHPAQGFLPSAVPADLVALLASSWLPAFTLAAVLSLGVGIGLLGEPEAALLEASRALAPRIRGKTRASREGGFAAWSPESTASGTSRDGFWHRSGVDR